MEIPEYSYTIAEHEKFMRIRPCQELNCNLHIHEYCEFIILWEGEAVCFIDNKVQKISAGTCVFVPQMIPHRYCSTGVINAAVVFVQHSHIAFSNLKFRKINFFSNLFTLDPVLLAYLKDHISNLDLVEYNNEKIFTDMPVFLLLSEMCKKYPECFENTEKIPTKNLDPLINQLLTYIINNHTDKLTLHKTAIHFGVSDEHLCRLISQGLPKEVNTFTKFLNSVRVKHAMELLNKTNMRIGEIADIVGFSTLRNFNKQFQKYMGCSPSEYQKNQLPL